MSSEKTEIDSTSVSSFQIDGCKLEAGALPSALYVVSTPIGNLRDVTVRALQTLAAVDQIACEDTRVTGVLLKHYGINAKMFSYHEHNAEKVRPRILESLNGGRSVALVSDAGTPLISDPGFRLVREAIELNHRIVPIPGCSAILSALVGCGVESDSFLFVGFLPRKSSGRRKRLEELNSVQSTLIFYESPHRLKAALADMAEILGNGRNAAVAREITKRYETFVRGSLSDLSVGFEQPPKGEIVIVVAPPGNIEPVESDSIDSMLLEQMETGSVSSAAGHVSRITKINRKELYSRALELKSGSGRDQTET